MHALSSLMKKELYEVFGDRSSRRGGLFQSLVITAVLGVFLPYGHVGAWVSGTLDAVALFGLLPGLPAAVLAADAIAGERERGTLATLLASPVREATLLYGKWLAAVTFGFLVGVAALVLAHAVVFFHAGVFAISARVVVGALVASAGSAALMASIGVLVSMYVGHARAAQQVSSVSSMVLVFGGGHLASALHLALTWSTLWSGALGAIIVAVVALRLGALLFRRDRLAALG
jgi:ABC-2 type transport system permease protein